MLANVLDECDSCVELVRVWVGKGKLAGGEDAEKDVIFEAVYW